MTSFTYQATDGILKDFATGTALPVTLTGTTVGGFDPHPNGGPVTNVASDAYEAFNGIVDLSGMDELDANSWSSAMTFDNLDPAKTYAITLSGNRAEPTYEGNRWARVSISGALAYTNASSTGTVENAPDSVSVSLGDNSDEGSVVKWTGIEPGPDGSFTVTSEWDDSQGVVPAERWHEYQGLLHVGDEARDRRGGPTRNVGQLTGEHRHR